MRDRKEPTLFTKSRVWISDVLVCPLWYNLGLDGVNARRYDDDDDDDDDNDDINFNVRGDPTV